MDKPTKEYTCYNARFAMIVICEKNSDLSNIKAIMDSINRQHFKANEKIIVFNNCKEPEWFSDDSYSDWIYMYTKYKDIEKLHEFAVKNIKSVYYCYVLKIVAPQTLLMITELLKDKKAKKNIMTNSLIFWRNYAETDTN